MLNIQAYEQSISLLRKAATPYGFVASVQNLDNYKRIWARDGIICTLAALLSGDAGLIATGKANIETLFDHQHPTGFIPSNVTPHTQAVSYGGTVGRADTPCWAVIGLCAYVAHTQDFDLAEKYKQHVERSFWVLDAWEFNGRHLVYVPQSGDWADEYIQHGYILFEQLLRVWALEWAAQIYQNADWQAKAAQIRTVLEQNFHPQTGLNNPYSPNLKHQSREASAQYWLMGFNPSRIYTYFDLQANSLAILLGLGNALQENTLLQFLTKQLQETTTILPSFSPAIEANDTDMRELRNNYAYEFRNKPHHFHNGGLWPVWNGWLAMALHKAGKKQNAQMLTQRVHAANQLADFEFNECLNGANGAPCGVPQCTWSAAGAVLAEHAADFGLLFPQTNQKTSKNLC
ncbi:Alkaline and neutral invertase [Flexibacter flexilis DSM 6793]|uniref:beta-fructofuranosidase n=1 Tax=Flexibacter flexilis DSM 6793 TaxID=927664 RepID=A0A1I1KK18_9BACT|nr:glycoside hydrolase 100 family protein [Flexibacter flexilis]SFC61011.1 Alkaline and neutral invertase [Flexibacter flexilis DSM 6793]